MLMKVIVDMNWYNAIAFTTDGCREMFVHCEANLSTLWLRLLAFAHKRNVSFFARKISEHFH